VVFHILAATIVGSQMKAGVADQLVRITPPSRLTVRSTDGTEQSLTVIDATDAPATPATADNPRESLAQRFASGEASAFDDVVAEYAPRLGRFAHRLLGWSGGHDDVEDIVQETFVAALKRQRYFRGDASLWTWLSAIAVNQCRTRLRRRKSWRRWIGFQRECHGDASPAPIVQDETTRRVREAVGQLKQDDREVIVLFYLENQSIRQIAEMLGKTGNAVEVRLHRARQRLALLLKDFADE
jgi:RNA polymerase sigma-70 factor, ECF subfamily